MVLLGAPIALRIVFEEKPSRKSGDEAYVEVAGAPVECSVRETDTGEFVVELSAFAAEADLEVRASLRHPLVGLEPLAGFPVRLQVCVEQAFATAAERARVAGEAEAAAALLRAREAEARQQREKEAAREAELQREQQELERFRGGASAAAKQYYDALQEWRESGDAARGWRQWSALCRRSQPTRSCCCRDVHHESVKSSYKRMALLLHPDKVGGGSEVKERASVVFVEVKRALEMLETPEKRKTYDWSHRHHGRGFVDPYGGEDEDEEDYDAYNGHEYDDDVFEMPGGFPPESWQHFFGANGPGFHFYPRSGFGGGGVCYDDEDDEPEPEGCTLCHNTAALDCENGMCGQCCKMHGQYTCLRHKFK